MNIASIYRKDASEQWFELEYGSRSVHDNLRHRGFEIIGRPLLLSSYAQLTIPIDRAELSWGGDPALPVERAKHRIRRSISIRFEVDVSRRRIT